MAKILIVCEYSGRVRDAFRALGHDALSIDLLPSEADGPHMVADIKERERELFNSGSTWDIMIAFPPCTHLSISGARWFKEKQQEQKDAVAFVQYLMALPVPRIAIENPIGVLSTFIRKPDQIIQPWQFGHGETKATCLWLKNLPLLTPTDIVDGRVPKVHWCAPGPNRWKERSRTYEGIARAMAEQWSKVL